MSAELPPFPPEAVHLGVCVLRPLLPAEAETLGPALAMLDPWRAAGYSASALTGYLRRSDPALTRYAVRVSDELAGVMCIRHPWLHGAYLELLGLLPAFQRRGLGRVLVQWFETRSFLTGPNAWIVVSAGNTPARRFYHRQGYVEAAALPGLVKSGYNEILLRKIKPGYVPDPAPEVKAR